MHPPRILVLATILGALTAGCTPAPAPEPSPVPNVPTCVPEFGGEPFPCTQAEYEDNQKMLARYAEAERVYREYDRLTEQELVSGAAEPSPELLALVSPHMRDAAKELRTNELEAEFSGTARIVGVERRQPSSQEGAPLVMAFCVDRSEWTVKYPDGGMDPTTPVYHVAGFDEHPGMTVRWLRLEEAPACER